MTEEMFKEGGKSRTEEGWEGGTGKQGGWGGKRTSASNYYPSSQAAAHDYFH